MKQGDLVRIRNTAGTQMFFPEIVGKVGVLISHDPAEYPVPRSVRALEVLVGEKMMFIALDYLEPA